MPQPLRPDEIQSLLRQKSSQKPPAPAAWNWKWPLPYEPHPSLQWGQLDYAMLCVTGILLALVFGSLYVLLDYLLLSVRVSAQSCIPSTTTVFVPVTQMETLTLWQTSTSTMQVPATSSLEAAPVASTISSASFTTMSTTTVSITQTVTVTASESFLGYVIQSGTTSWIGASPSSGASVVYTGATTVTVAPIPSLPISPSSSVPPAPSPPSAASSEDSTTRTTITSTSTLTRFTTVTPTLTVPMSSSTLFRITSPDLTTTLTSTRYMTVSLSAVSSHSSFTGMNSDGWNSTADAQTAPAQATTVTMSEVFFQGIGNATTSTTTSYLTTTIGATITQTFTSPAFVTTVSGSVNTVQPTATTETILVQATATTITVAGSPEASSAASGPVQSISTTIGLPPGYSLPSPQPTTSTQPDSGAEYTVTSFVSGHGTTFTISTILPGTTPHANSSVVSVVSTFFATTLIPSTDSAVGITSTRRSGGLGASSVPGESSTASSPSQGTTQSSGPKATLTPAETSTSPKASSSTTSSGTEKQSTQLRPSSKTSTASPTSASSSAQPSSTACGEQGDFTMTFDDLPAWHPRLHKRQSNNQTSNATSPDITTYPPVNLVGPYHHMLFSNGYVLAPKPAEPFQPVSPPYVAAFVDPVKAKAPTNTPNTIEPGEFAEDNGGNPSFWFDPVSAAVGCDSPSSDCTLEATAWAWNSSIQDESPLHQHNYTLPPCQGEDCKLKQIDFPDNFANLTGVQFRAIADSKPRMFFVDNLNMRWSNNSCAAGQQRDTATRSGR